MLSYPNNDTLRKIIEDDNYIVYKHPNTIKEKEQFKDILDTENDILVPYVKNVRLSSIRKCSIKIRNKYSVYIDYHDNGFGSFVKNKNKFYGTISTYINSTDTLKRHSEIKNRIKIRKYIHQKERWVKKC